MQNNSTYQKGMLLFGSFSIRKAALKFSALLKEHFVAGVQNLDLTCHGCFPKFNGKLTSVFSLIPGK